jgi:type I restriction enzyme S subunit
MGKQTTNLASLNLTTLKSFPVPDLSFVEQVKIVDEVERQTSLIEAMQLATREASRHSESLRTALLAAAFSGNLVPQDPSDEPGSILLERISAEAVSSPKPTARRKPRTPSRQKAKA